MQEKTGEEMEVKVSENGNGSESTYEIVEAPVGARAIICRVCGERSYNENHIRERYCVVCYRFHP